MELSKNEIKFLQSMEAARIASSHDDQPHVKPVSFIYQDNFIFIATDYETRTFKNIKINPCVGVVIDTYIPGGHKAVCIQGKVEILEQGVEFLKIYDLFEQKFAWVKNDPWKENEAPILKIILLKKTSWGLNG